MFETSFSKGPKALGFFGNSVVPLGILGAAPAGLATDTGSVHPSG